MQTTPAQDTLLLAEETVPLDVAHGQLDAALAAQLEVPAFVPPPPATVPDSGVSLVVPLMLTVALVLLFGLRAMARGSRGWMDRLVREAASPGKASAPATRPRTRPVREEPAVSVRKAPPPPPPRKTVELPPHVAAMLSRLDERRVAGAAPPPAPNRPAAPPPESAPPPQTLGDRGLDVVIGS